MSKSQTEYLRHILDECNFITTVITANTKKDDLIDNDILKRAVVRSLEIIGEASKKISVDVKIKWNQINHPPSFFSPVLFKSNTPAIFICNYKSIFKTGIRDQFI